MRPFTIVEGVAAPLMLANVDTDVITPMQRIVHVRREQLGEWAFEPLRYRSVPAAGDPEDSTPREENPEFVLNRPPWRGAPILIAGDNFGCGSSRETAVWALEQVGIRVVIAPGFGDIFESNCFQNGLLPIRLDPADVERCAAAARRAPADAQRFRVDLAAGSVTLPDGSAIAFPVDAWRREALLEGRDEIEQTRTRLAAIEAWQAHDRNLRPWIWAESERSPRLD